MRIRCKKEDMVTITRKSPLGVMPKHIWDDKRFSELIGAIKRYLDANLEVPIAWIEEYNELSKKIKVK